MEQYYISSTKYNLQERQTKLNGRVFDLVFYVTTLDGARKQKKLSGFKSKTAAKEAYADFVTKHCTLAKIAPIKKTASAQYIHTVADLVPQYITVMFSQNKESSLYDKKNLLESKIVPMLGSKKMTELTKTELFRWQSDLWATKNERTGEPYAYAYLVKIRAILSAFLSWAQDMHNYPNHLPEVKTPPRRLQKTEMLFWTREEFDQFIRCVDDPRYKMIFEMSFFTGRRKGEILALSPSDFKQSSILFNKTYSRKTVDGSPYKITTSKNEKIGYTPICPALRSALQSYQGEEPFFFGGENPISENTLSHAFEKYMRKANVTRIRYHDLRHSFVSILIHNGASLFAVAELIGDTVEQVTRTYGHLYESDKIKLIESIS